LRLEEVSATFHGRDVFAPAAARLADGARFERSGPLLEAPVALADYEATRRGGGLDGCVLRVDRFGNLITSIRERDLDDVFAGVPFATLDISVAGTRVDESARTYGLARPGLPFAYMGSAGRLEVGVPGGSAATVLGARGGSEVLVRRRGGRR
jgi:S-adenosylmethionine hydrolase